MNIDDIAFYANLTIANVWLATGNYLACGTFLLACAIIFLNRYLGNREGSK